MSEKKNIEIHFVTVSLLREIFRDKLSLQRERERERLN